MLIMNAATMVSTNGKRSTMAKALIQTMKKTFKAKRNLSIIFLIKNREPLTHYRKSHLFCHTPPGVL